MTERNRSRMTACEGGRMSEAPIIVAEEMADRLAHGLASDWHMCGSPEEGK